MRITSFKRISAMDGQSTLSETLDAIDEVIAKHKANIKRGEALARLKKNQDFIDVILHGYIKAEAKKLFKILTDPSGASPYTNDQIILKLDSISNLKGYIGTDEFKGTVEIEAYNAPLEIAKEEDYRVEITADYAKGME